MNVSDVEIPTWSEPPFLKYCEEVAARSQNMVESGCFIGASARRMLRANPTLHLWTVDHFQAFEFNRHVAEIFLNQWISEGRCELIHGDMDKAGEMLVHMRGKIDAIMIDDGHAEEDLRRDIRNSLPLLRSGGELFGHDFDLPHNDVARGVLSMLPSNKLRFPVPRCWSYIKP